MEYKKTVDPSEVAFLGVRRIIGNSHENQVFPINIREVIAKSVSRIKHSLPKQLGAPGHGRMVPPKGSGTAEPVIPLKLVSPRHFQVVTEKEPHSVDFLPDLPLIDIRVSPQVTQPGVNRRSRMFLEPRVGMVFNEEFDVSSIPGNRSFLNTKQLKNVTEFAPKYLDSGIYGRFSSFHKKCRSMRLESLENKYRTIGGIIQYLETAA
jgi:hypothetical protein